MAPLTYHSKDVFNIVRNERGGANVIFTGNELTDGFWLQTKLWGPTPGLILGAFQTKIRRWKTPQFQKTPQVHGHTSQVLFVHTQDFTSVLLSDQTSTQPSRKFMVELKLSTVKTFGNDKRPICDWFDTKK